MDEAASQLLHARDCLQREMGGLGEGAVSLAIALPEMDPDQAKVIRAPTKVSADPGKVTEGWPYDVTHSRDLLTSPSALVRGAGGRGGGRCL